jgi:secreted PhoX family phosphatase
MSRWQSGAYAWPNDNGHIIRWAEAGGDHAATTFEWDIYLLLRLVVCPQKFIAVKCQQWLSSPDETTF